MSRNYKFHNPKGVYFVSFAVIDWLDVFTRNEYKDLILESLEFCQKKKGMEIHAWCIMTNHMHLIFRGLDAQNPALRSLHKKPLNRSANVSDFAASISIKHLFH